ncbi:MAG: OmpH family outer membrane protein [Candidatus Omnitrophica bacterium]|nr:OmpH family outer membrane protein [Candidatus Omnitrophota bacterium]
MKRIVLAVTAIFTLTSLMVALPGISQAKEYKMAYVDLAKVFDEYKKTKEAEKSLADKGKVKEEERKKLVDEVRKMKDEQAFLSEKAKAEKQTAIDDRITKLQDFDRKTREELMKERNDMLGGILKDIEKVVSDYSKENGYDMVLNSRMLLYGKEDLDVTNDVLKKLNK